MHDRATDSIWLNGQSLGTFTGKATLINGVGDFAILGRGSNNTFYSGDVSELIVYARALEPAERQKVEQYLMTKYHL
jgi:hypothetical protein